MTSREDQPSPPRAIVVGGGIAGLAVALGMVREGVRVDLLDARPDDAGRPIPPDGRTTAILEPGLRFLDALGVWQNLRLNAAPLARLRIVNVGSPAGDVTFAASEIGKPAFGYNVENGVLHAALLRAAEKAGVALHLGVRASGLRIDGERALVECGDGRCFAADLVIGADGRTSKIRELTGIRTWRRRTGQTAIVTRFAHARPHHHTSIELHRPGGPFTMVPLRGRQSSLVWAERTAEAERLLALGENQFAQALAERVRPWLGEPDRIVPPVAFPIETLLAFRLTAPRTALAGEAAHMLSPLGAQGFNLSLRDAEALAAAAGEAVAGGAPLGSRPMLERYAGRRQSDIRARVLAVAGFGELVRTGLAPIVQARGLGLRAIGGLPPARRLVMHSLMRPVPPLRA